jgi:hypothetical protein
MCADFTAETRLTVDDQLGAALIADAGLLDQLGDKLTALGDRYTGVLTMLEQLDPKGGFAKLVEALNPDSLTRALDAITFKLGEVRSGVDGISGLTAKIAADGTVLFAPLEAVSKAQRDAAAAADPLTGAQAFPGHAFSVAPVRSPATPAPEAEKPPPLSLIGGTTGVILDTQLGAGTIGTVARPFTSAIQEAGAFQTALIGIQLRTHATRDEMAALRQALLARISHAAVSSRA